MKQAAAYLLQQLSVDSTTPAGLRVEILRQLAASLDSDSAKQLTELANDIAECERQQAELDLDLEHCASRCGQLALALTQPQPAHAS